MVSAVVYCSRGGFLRIFDYNSLFRVSLPKENSCMDSVMAEWTDLKLHGHER